MIKYIVIPARYASTRLPGKPLREICGKTILYMVYEKAMLSNLKDHVIIATDDKRIQDAAIMFDADVVMTSPDCKSGTDRCHDAIKGKDADIIVNLQGDEPFIRPDMVDLLFDVMLNERLDMATLCTPITDVNEYTNPNVVKVVLDKYGFALYFSRSPIPFKSSHGSAYISQHTILNNQCIYKHIGIYAFSRTFLEKYVTMERGVLEETESLEQLRVLENGFRIKVLITDYNGFGIDTEEDLERAKTFSFRKTT